MIYGHKWRMCRKRSRAKTENAVYGGTVFIIETEYMENKKPLQRTLYENNLEKILFSHDILLSLQQTKSFFEMAK